MLATGKITLVFVAAVWIAKSVFATEVTEPAGAAHGYPGLCDINGKKVADGEFRQWLENHHLHVAITYRFPDGRVFEEKARFRQQSELTQEQWSWKELTHGKVQREFSADFSSGIASARILKDNRTCQKRLTLNPGEHLPGLDSQSHLVI